MLLPTTLPANVLPAAALDVADRLATALMAVVRAIARVASTGSTPTLPETTARTLFFRLARLVTRLIRINNFGVPAPKRPAPADPAAEHPTPPAPPPPPRRRHHTPSLPRRLGWLLAALPEIAPAVVADLRALLADPASAALLDAAPTLLRTLRPLLRGLGLEAIPPPDAPLPTSPPPHRPNAGTTSPPPNPPPPQKRPTPAAASKSCLSGTRPFHVHLVTPP